MAQGTLEISLHECLKLAMTFKILLVGHSSFWVCSVGLSLKKYFRIILTTVKMRFFLFLPSLLLTLYIEIPILYKQLC
jgi:hypothetical protein